MAKASIHIISISRPTAEKAVMHNQRVFAVDYAIDSETRNEYLNLQNIREYGQKVLHDYRENQKHGRNLNSKARPFREGVINLNEHHKLSDVRALTKEIEKRFGIQALDIAVHNDEGHINNDGEKVYNHHAHVIFGWYNFENHQSVKLDANDMRKMQTFIAEFLGMERGESKKITKRERLSHKQYKRAMREADEREFKALATQKMLKEEVAELRQQLKEQGGKREDYAEMEAEIKDLKAQIKSKDLTIAELQEYKNSKAKYFKERAELLQQNEKQRQDIQGMLQIINTLQHENKMLKNQPSVSAPEEFKSAPKSALENAERMLKNRASASGKTTERSDPEH